MSYPPKKRPPRVKHPYTTTQAELSDVQQEVFLLDSLLRLQLSPEDQVGCRRVLC